MKLRITRDGKPNARDECVDRTVENGHVLEIELDEVRSLENTNQIVYTFREWRGTTLVIDDGNRRNQLGFHDLKNLG